MVHSVSESRAISALITSSSHRNPAARERGSQHLLVKDAGRAELQKRVRAHTFLLAMLLNQRALASRGKKVGVLRRHQPQPVTSAAAAARRTRDAHSGTAAMDCSQETIPL